VNNMRTITNSESFGIGLSVLVWARSFITTAFASERAQG
jgi:hypothetical protein